MSADSRGRPLKTDADWIRDLSPEDQREDWIATMMGHSLITLEAHRQECRSNSLVAWQREVMAALHDAYKGATQAEVRLAKTCEREPNQCGMGRIAESLAYQAVFNQDPEVMR